MGRNQLPPRGFTRGLLLASLCLAPGLAPGLFGQTAGEPVAVSSEHPRLFLRPARLRLLKRERERTSARWQQFETLIAGGAPMPELGLSHALYHQIAANAEHGRRAITWALRPGADLRQQALVFDWCQDLLTPAQSTDLAARLKKGLEESPNDDNIAAVRSRVLAAIVLYDHVPDVPQRELERVMRVWWHGKMVPALKAGKTPIARDDAYALFELLHAMRDNTNLDLREDVPRFFKEFPIEHLLSYYPAVYEGPDTNYFIGAERKTGEPDLRLAALSRIADLAIVGYDLNAPESQVLQGWLMHDKFVLRGTFGAPYEFLWANPYQPGLSYYHVPLVYYNADEGRLFARSSWEESAKWFGYFDGVMQVFENGRLSIVNPQRSPEPISVEEAFVLLAQSGRKFRVPAEETGPVFLVGLDPRRAYRVEVDDEEMFEASADAGGIIHLDLPHARETGVRLAPAQ